MITVQHALAAPATPGPHIEISGNTKAEVIGILKRAIPLPAYCGSNFDAVDEALGDWAAGLRAPHTLVWRTSAQFLASADGRVLCEIFGDLERTGGTGGTGHGQPGSGTGTPRAPRGPVSVVVIEGP